MSSGHVRDLTTGPILNHLSVLAVPAAIGMLFHTLYNLTDVYFASMLSTNSQAGLSLGYLVYFFIAAFGFGLNASMAALMGHAIGKKDKNIELLACNGIIFSIFLSILLILFGWLLGFRILELVSEPGVYRDLGLQYYFWLLISLPAFLISYTCNGILQAQGNTHAMQRALVLAFFLNLFLNPLLIFGIPGFWEGIGFDGIALSTVMSNFLVMVFMFFNVMRSKVLSPFHYWRIKLNFFIAITKQMLPPTMSFQMIIVGVLIMQFALKDFGSEAIAGYSIAVRIEQLLLLPILGIAHALIPLVAQNFGAGEYDRVRKCLFLCTKIGMISMIAAYPAIWLFSSYAMMLFTDSQTVVEVGVSYLMIDGLVLPIYAFLFSVNSLLQGLKRPTGIFWIGFMRQGIGCAFFIWVFISILGFDYWGVWYGTVASVIFGSLLSSVVAYKVSKSEIGGIKVTN
jgi:putative MATE family efflux protein